MVKSINTLVDHAAAIQRIRKLSAADPGSAGERTDPRSDSMPGNLRRQAPEKATLSGNPRGLSGPPPASIW